MKLKPIEVIVTETCGEETCAGMSAIIYSKGTLHPDIAVGLCETHHALYATEGLTNDPPKRKRGRPKHVKPEDMPPPIPAPPTGPPVVIEPTTTVVASTLPPPASAGDLEIPKMSIVLAFTEEAKAEASATLGMLREVTLTTPEHEQWAMTSANALAKRHDELEKKRKSWVAPLKKVTGDIESEFRPVLQLLDEGISILKAKVGEYRAALEAEKQKALAAMSAAVQAGDTAQAQALATQIEVAAPPPPDKGSVRMVWTGQVTDPTKIPAQFMVPDVNALLSLTASLQRDPGIPGWQAWQVPEVKISRR